jgi:hypothetical protein
VAGGLHAAARRAAGSAPEGGRGGPLARAALPGRSVAALLGLLSLLSLLAVAAGGLSGCAKPQREDGYVVDIDADSVRVPAAAEDATTAPDGRKYQFRAVCTEARHPGGMLVLSKWVDDLAVVRDLGQYHGDHKAKGHRWRIERRIEHHARP